jgi:hypothetical protein
MLRDLLATSGLHPVYLEEKKLSAKSLYQVCWGGKKTPPHLQVPLKPEQVDP